MPADVTSDLPGAVADRRVIASFGQHRPQRRPFALGTGERISGPRGQQCGNNRTTVASQPQSAGGFLLSDAANPVRHHHTRRRHGTPTKPAQRHPPTGRQTPPISAHPTRKNRKVPIRPMRSDHLVGHAPNQV
ncbi:hypothetical protein, partial [Micromonospora sicca]|uniref:hypothetical protein n=1 Tax=Micromonospora sicca TaxID=2202420 RepID=UPI001F3B7965